MKFEINNRWSGRADLSGAVLSGAVLIGADLRGAVLRGVPFVENIDAKILASIDANKALNQNGLEMSDWHDLDKLGGKPCDETNWCRTTHCRAGYAVCVAGKEGFDLERRVGSTAVAAILLYLKSTPDAPIPNFYCSNDEAMEDIKARAAKQNASAP